MKKIVKVAAIPQSLNVLLKGQFSMLSEKYEVICIASPGNAMDELREREGVRTVPIRIERRISPLHDIASLWKLIVFFWKERPDMVHSITPKAGLLSMMAACLTGVPVRIHTFTGLVFPTSDGLKRKLLMLTDRITCICATHINPEGYGVKSDLEKYRITGKPMSVIGNGNVNGIDLEFFRKNEDLLAKAAPYMDSKLFTFIYIGRIVRDKGINELIRVFVKINEKYPQSRLILVGSIEEKDPVDADVLSIIKSFPSIEYVGFQKDVRPFLAASDVFVFPSYREGFPNVVMQAGAMDLPCIVTDINGSNEIIIDGENGIIIPVKNEKALFSAMENLITDPELLASLSKNARQMIMARYEQRQFWTQLLNYYDNAFKTVGE